MKVQQIMLFYIVEEKGMATHAIPVYAKRMLF